MSAKKLSANDPRDISDRAWYYVNANSIELIAQEDSLGLTSMTRLTRKKLEQMLAELKPAKKRKP